MKTEWITYLGLATLGIGLVMCALYGIAAYNHPNTPTAELDNGLAIAFIGLVIAGVSRLMKK